MPSLVFKEMNWKDEMENIKRKRNEEEIASRNKDNLTLIEARKREYGVYKEKHRRFHALKFGIGVVS